MSKEPVVTPDIVARARAWIGEHLATYLDSGGAKGHIIDMSHLGGLAFMTTLLLKTVGRKSGEARISPLIYGDIGGEVVIVASKGGADVDPAWYTNLKSGTSVEIQIATQAFRARWREPQGAERQAIWNFMVKMYPPYSQYQAATSRQIPIVMLTATGAIDPFKK